jgi:cytoskeletal protein CcmA (bactofilin family)
MTDTRNQPEVTAEMSVIGRGIRVVGNIEASVDIHLQGEVKGDLTCATLIMDEGSVIEGNVHAERARVSGRINGSIKTLELAVEASARIDGSVTYSRIRLVNGGTIDGKMTYRDEAGKKLKLVPPGSPKKDAPKPITTE